MNIVRYIRSIFPAVLVGGFVAMNLFMALVPAPADAQSVAPATTGAEATQQGDCNTAGGFDPCGTLSKVGLSTDSPENIAFRLIKVFLSFIGIIAVTLIIYGGFTWMTSGGSPEKVKKGKDILLWAILGTVLILSSLGIVEFIDGFI